MPDDYTAQHRGSAADYARYLMGMDASMRQKVALTAAHFLCVGRVADMGTGSGYASHAFASLYPQLEVIGVDVSEAMITLASEKYRLPNLRFMVGDAAARVFAPASLDGILSSSVLHHVTSFNGYDYDAARRALAAQTEQLKPHGLLVVRDFVSPGDEPVLLDLPADDGDESDDPRTCSTAALFERFAREFRPLSERPGFETECVDGPERVPSHRRFRTTAKLAAEFVLRKDYRADWESEVKEEYTYFTQEEFEQVFAGLGMRVLASTPIYNPWIVRNRYEGKFVLRDEGGAVRSWPPTNYVVVGERVASEEGVDFRVRDGAPPLEYLTLEHFEDVRTGLVRDLVRRPNTTLDVVPWFESNATLYVLARTSYPRPILRSGPSHALDGSRICPWTVEPLTFVQDDRPEGQTIEQALWEYARVPEADLHAFEEGSEFYPSPGGISERIRSTFVRIEPTLVQHEVGPRSRFSTSGRVQAIEAEQVLRATQVDGLADARLELNVYDLLARRGRSFGPWLGEAVVVDEMSAPPHVTDVSALELRPSRRVFRRVVRNPRPFVELSCRYFDEVDASGGVLRTRPLELVTPIPCSAITVSTAVLRRFRREVFIGVDDDDLPAAQMFRGNSEILVAPAWRLPHGVADERAALAFVRDRLLAEYGIVTSRVVRLGGRYHPTPGVTPEVVHPFAVEVSGTRPAARSLTWLSLDALVRRVATLRDGHLRIVALRAHHALHSTPVS